MKPSPAFFLCVAVLLVSAGLTACGPAGAQETQPAASSPAALETPALTPQSTLTATTAAPSLTPEPDMRAGIPATLEECNRMQIYGPEGALDQDLIGAQMELLLAQEKAYLESNSITGAAISPLTILTSRPFSEPDKYPFDYIRAEGLLMPISCTLVDDAQGGWRLLVGMIIKRDRMDTAVAVLHVLADHAGLLTYMSAAGEAERYEAEFSPAAVFAAMRTGPKWYFSIRPWVPSENANPDLVGDWRVSADLVALNQDAPVFLNAYLAGLELDPALKSQNMMLLERMIFPAQWLSVTAVK